MSLEGFSEHCRAMSQATHKPECKALVKGRWYSSWVRPNPECGGCVTDADRYLFRQLGGEVDRYLAGELEDRTASDEDVSLWEDA